MSGEGVFPFDPGRVAALGRLAATINAAAAPPPITEPVLLREDGFVLLPVPDFGRVAGAPQLHVWCQAHAGLTLQWQSAPEQDGLLVHFRGGSPDGDDARDGALVFLTRRGLRALVADLQAIGAALDAEA